MESPDDRLVYACLTHVPLTLDLPARVRPIHLGAAQRPGAHNLRDLAAEWDEHHSQPGSTAGAFARRSLVRERRPDATRAGICPYRKFVSRRRISGVRDPRYRVMEVVPIEALAGERFASALWPGDATFIASAPRRFTRVFWHRRGYLKEYARDHCVEDLLRFTAEAADVGVIERGEVIAFLNEDVIVPRGVELGFYPAPFWPESIEKIERVVRRGIAQHAIVREDHQARLWSFPAERLGSYLLLKRFCADVAGGLGGCSERLPRRRWTARVSHQLNPVVAQAHGG